MQSGLLLLVVHNNAFLFPNPFPPSVIIDFFVAAAWADRNTVRRTKKVKSLQQIIYLIKTLIQDLGQELPMVGMVLMLLLLSTTLI